MTSLTPTQLAVLRAALDRCVFKDDLARRLNKNQYLIKRAMDALQDHELIDGGGFMGFHITDSGRALLAEIDGKEKKDG